MYIPEVPEHSESWIRANIMLCGKTGVGKTTLINTIFGETVGQTGVGHGQTHGVNYHLPADLDAQHVGFYDFEGMELDRSITQYVDFLDEHIASKWDEPQETSINLAWVCVNAKLGRFEEGPICDELAKRGIPYIIVMTQTTQYEDGEFEPGQTDLLNYILSQAPARNAVAVVQVCAKSAETMPVEHGLEELLSLTVDVAPEAVRTSLNIGQQLNAERKRHEAEKVVRRNTALAFPVGAVPIAGDLALNKMIRNTSRDLLRIYKIDVETADVLVPLMGKAILLGHGAVQEALKKGITKLFEKIGVKVAEATAKNMAKALGPVVALVSAAQAALTYKFFGAALISTLDAGLHEKFEDEIAMFTSWAGNYSELWSKFKS
jgi:GTP-binding protein EngB required for normal cell division